MLTDALAAVAGMPANGRCRGLVAGGNGMDAIMAKPYKGMGPAVPMCPGLPAHAPVPIDAAQSSRLTEKGLMVQGVAISPKTPENAMFSGVFHWQGQKDSNLI